MRKRYQCLDTYGLHTIFAVLLLSSTIAAQVNPAKIKGDDYSVRGGEYSLLNNLMLRGVERVEYVDTQQSEAYGVKYMAARFLVESEVRVTASGDDVCASYESRCELTQVAEFEVLVGLDPADEIHDQMLKYIHDYWAENKPFQWKKVDAPEHLNYKDGRYIMFQALLGPYGMVRTKRLIWADGKVIKFEFKRFTRTALHGYYKNLSGRFTEDEALENFVGTTVRVRVGGVDIQARQMKGSFRDEFFKLYNAGTFKGAS